MVKGSLGLTQGMGVTLNAEDGTRIIVKAPPTPMPISRPR